MKFALILTIAFIAFSASAKPKFMKNFKAAYPAAKMSECSVCHVSESNFAMNSYGEAYINSELDFKAIENEDSDNDGSSNIAEINAGTNPGDKSSVPVIE